uniref:TSC22 domain family protein 3-like n=1 Tax=Pristiophorus japonicus TaxID=55135 RepID=UPI00398E53F6
MKGLRVFDLAKDALAFGAEAVDKYCMAMSWCYVVAIKPTRHDDLVKTHLMVAVQEEVRVLKEQIKELVEKNSMLERENSFLKKLASPEQLQQFQLQNSAAHPKQTMSPLII